MTSFIKIPDAVLQDRRLNHTQILLYGVIMSLSKKEWYCRASNKKMWEIMWLEKRAIQRHLNTLSEKWFITIEMEGTTNRKIYIRDVLTDTGVWNDTGVWTDTGGVSELTPKYINEYLFTNVNKIPPKKNEKKSTTSWKSKRTTNEHLLVWEKKEQFKKFWDTYPHVSGRSNRKVSIPRFLELDTEQVLLWATLLKREVECWIENWQYVKASERRLKNFTPINETQKQRRLMAIFECHMRQQEGKRERMERLIQDFPNVDFKKLREELSEKNSLLHKMTFI